MKIAYYFILFISINLFSQENHNLHYYFGDLSTSFNPNIPKPSEFLLNQGEVGASHVSHDRLVNYMYSLAESSERVSIENRGNSFEGRPLILLTITSKNNHKNLNEIRKNHLNQIDLKNKKSNFYDRPVVIYQGYSIHGNEPSGSNAALLYAYYLAASENEKLKNQLDNSIVPRFHATTLFFLL